jgi:DNA mismatch repair protein MutS2
VQVGIMKLNVPLESLYKIRDEKEQKQQIQSNKYTNIALKKTEDISTELDVRGLTLDEALLRVDKYLDDAYMAGISVITIIHGKGTGVLRKGIQDMLRNEENIKSFRLGRIDEGGSGVTVVEFK